MENENKSESSVFYNIVSFIYLIIAKLIFRMKFVGRENIPQESKLILMGNHTCFLDPLTLAIIDRKRILHFMAKKELFESRFMGWIYRHLHAFPVDRGNIDMTAMRTAVNVLKNGDTLGIFPEGTRSKTGYMLPLQSGASLLALKSGCDVVPVYIDGGYKPFRRTTVIIGHPIEMADLRQGRMNKETCDILTKRIEGVFAHLSNGKSLPPASAEETVEKAG